MKVVVVGGVAEGMSVAARARGMAEDTQTVGPPAATADPRLNRQLIR